MMQKKRAILFITVTTLAIILSFICGFLFGKVSVVKKRHQNKGVVKFYQHKKYIGKELDENEKKSLLSFIKPYEKCLKNTLDSTEYQTILEIQKEVLSLSKNNNSVKFRFKDLKNAKDNQFVIKKVKKCQRITYKSMNKDTKKVFKKSLKKMKLTDIISIFHGIK